MRPHPSLAPAGGAWRCSTCSGAGPLADLVAQPCRPVLADDRRPRRRRPARGADDVVDLGPGFLDDSPPAPGDGPAGAG